MTSGKGQISWTTQACFNILQACLQAVLMKNSTENFENFSSLIWYRSWPDLRWPSNNWPSNNLYFRAEKFHDSTPRQRTLIVHSFGMKNGAKKIKILWHLLKIFTIVWIKWSCVASCGLTWPHMTSHDLIWPHMTSCDHMKAFDIIWPNSVP